jgi:predicted aspartyl protease
MRFKKFKPTMLLNKSEGASSANRLKSRLLIAPSGNFQWRGSVTFTVDTGADTVTIPRKFLHTLGLDDVEATDQIEIELADGSITVADVIMCNLRLLTNDSANKDVLIDVECVIVDEGEEPLLGLSVLSLYDYVVVSGQLILLRQNSDLWQGLPEATPFEMYKVGSGRNPPTNLVPPMKIPKQPKLPKPLNPPASTKPRAGGFLPPQPPTKPYKPK